MSNVGTSLKEFSRLLDYMSDNGQETDDSSKKGLARVLSSLFNSISSFLRPLSNTQSEEETIPEGEVNPHRGDFDKHIASKMNNTSPACGKARHTESTTGVSNGLKSSWQAKLCMKSAPVCFCTVTIYSDIYVVTSAICALNGWSKCTKNSRTITKG